MNRLLTFLIFITSTFLYQSGFSQTIKADVNSFFVDEKNKMILWHVSDLDSIKNLKAIKFKNKLEFKKLFKFPLSYQESYVVSHKENKEYKLYITKLPIVQIAFNETKVNSKNKITGSFTYFDNELAIKSNIGIRYRGNLSLTFSKKSFDLEFWKDSLGAKNRDVQFTGLRSDDDWILDAMFNEPLRIRSTVAAQLWNTIHEPYYSQKEPEAKSGFDTRYVEVFRNNEYYGIYQLSESVDRKQLKIKKNKASKIRGELFKANSYKGGPSFKKISEKPIYIDSKWNGWEIKYPVINDEYYWGNLAVFSELVINESSAKFLNEIENKIEVSNAIDYYIFMNLLGATDNMGKNYYLAKYDENEPYFFIPWDLDGVWGVIQDGKEQYFTSKIVLGNGLFKRLLNENPNNYKEKLKNRWQLLRTKEFSNEKLFQRINQLFSKFTKEKVYEREFLVWQNKLNEKPNQEHYQHLENWLKERLIYLDNYFQKL